MMAERRGEITHLLDELTHGNRTALDRLFPLVYAEMRSLAGACFRGERGNHTMQPTALVHEVYLRLVGSRYSGFESRRQFFALAAGMMRRLLVDHARSQRAQKRGGPKTVLAGSLAAATPGPIDALELGEALEHLEQADPDLCEVFSLRFFGGLTVEEIAAVLDVSEPTVKRRWSAARAWLGRELRHTAAGGA